MLLFFVCITLQLCNSILMVRWDLTSHATVDVFPDINACVSYIGRDATVVGSIRIELCYERRIAYTNTVNLCFLTTNILGDLNEMKKREHASEQVCSTTIRFI